MRVFSTQNNTNVAAYGNNIANINCPKYSFSKKYCCDIASENVLYDNASFTQLVHFLSVKNVRSQLYKNASTNTENNGASYSFSDNLRQEAIQDGINYEFFVRVVLAGLEIIRLLHVQHPLLYESFGIGAGGDCSSGADLLAEAIFRKFLLPIYSIDSEESGFLRSDVQSPYTIVLDPLDGSSNFKSNIPYYGASLALCDANGRVCEACVINYVSREISYLNDRLLTIVSNPCVFMLDSTRFYVPFESLDSDNKTSSRSNSSYSLPYQPIDFSSLFHRQFSNDSSSDSYATIKQMCNTIMETQTYLPLFNQDLMQLLFQHKVITCRFEPNYAYPVLECGIFEKASHHPDLVALLLECGLKFRSLGATALSLGFSFRYLFVLLPSSVRKYDGMAGFYLAQNQNIKGNINEYLQAIPSMKKYFDNQRYIIISVNSQIVDTLSNAVIH
ncbi:hypothetical protein CQA66_01120 [Helicobacter aurati]|uniref:Inositol monophosphatase n=1 Tax=Helicobacter aurati TaxID=137778 RepID=A0A3D8JAB9_9HELI|nr:inositol monophosphatase family protein [Helicobacter aurati]RDU73814.1 hypothetical protein CQA66_01120 [Helicobacter aurati]